jgi:hypothetical protein
MEITITGGCCSRRAQAKPASRRTMRVRPRRTPDGNRYGEVRCTTSNPKYITLGSAGGKAMPEVVLTSTNGAAMLAKSLSKHK